MNVEDFRALADRASTIEGRRDDRLAEVHDRIHRAGRRRQLVAATASAIAVVLALSAGVGLLALTDSDRTPPAEPAPRPTSTPRVPDKAPSVRRVTYAEGQTIHWGDRTIDVGSKVWNLEATDDGVVFSRERDSLARTCSPSRVGCGDLWFTDGSDVVRIGRATGSVIRGFDIDFSTAGSTVVWSEPDPEDHSRYYPERGEYVAYDTGARREVGRFGTQRSVIVAVLDDYVYWLPDERACVDFYGECLRFKGSAMRLEVSTGRQVQISWASYVADRRSRPRTLVSPQIEEIDEGTVVTPGHAEPKFSEGFTFRRDGTHLLGDDGTVEVTVRVARTGKPLKLRVPPGYTEADFFGIIQWIDEDRVVVSAEDAGDLFICRLSSGRCRIAVTGSPLTGFNARG